MLWKGYVKMMRIQLSDHFSYKRLLRFTIPSIIMMVCTSVYSIIDGLFVSNYVGTVPFAALNLMIPPLMGLSTIGFMFGAGGSALVAIKLGEGDHEKANDLYDHCGGPCNRNHCDHFYEAHCLCHRR